MPAMAWTATTEIRRREPNCAIVDGQGEVVRRAVPLDFVSLEERRLERSRCDVERDRASLRQHFERSFVQAVLLPKVAVDPIVERRRLADVQDVATRAQHAVDAGTLRE